MTASSTSTRALLELFAVEHPLVQAPMAGVSTAAMAAAVSNAGALGSIGVGATNADGARAMIADFRQRSARSLNVNVFCHAPARADAKREATWLEQLRPEFSRVGGAPPASLHEIYRSFLVDDDMLAALVEARPRVVSFHFGVPPESRVRALRDAGVVIVGSATSVAEARLLVAGGVQVVVAQGYEAGGHRGVFDADAPDDRLSTSALTQLLARELTVPIVAAGGIMDGAGIGAALGVGASAAQLGTAFILCPESLADEGYRQTMRSDAAHHTVMTRVISGRPARCLANRFTALGADVADGDVPDYPIAYDAGKALHAMAKAKSDFGYGAQWAGQGAPLARAMPAAELVATLVDEIRAP